MSAFLNDLYDDYCADCQEISEEELKQQAVEDAKEKAKEE
jgi:hypothetical protein